MDLESVTKKVAFGRQAKTEGGKKIVTPPPQPVVQPAATSNAAGAKGDEEMKDLGVEGHANMDPYTCMDDFRVDIK